MPHALTPTRAHTSTCTCTLRVLQSFAWVTRKNPCLAAVPPPIMHSSSTIVWQTLWNALVTRTPLSEMAMGLAVVSALSEWGIFIADVAEGSPATNGGM